MAITYEGATEQIRQAVHWHALLRRELERRVGTVSDAVTSGMPYHRQVVILRGYLEDEILPHAEAEERSLCQAAARQADGSELVRALVHEHRELAYLTGRLRPGVAGHEAATVAEWIATLFAGHVAKVNDLLLPALVGSGEDLAFLLAEIREPLTGAQA